jgi:DNA ligase (NAD+)
MDKKEVRERIEKLKKVINHHRYLYHAQDQQEISDEALDSLKKELFELEKAHPEFVTLDSPTQRVGGEALKEFKKITHRERMLSLNDAFSYEDMQDWLLRVSKLLTEQEKQNIDFYAELKIDGLAIELEYQGGMLLTASTRGDGTVGEDITQNIKTVEAVPLTLESNENLVVRGEVFISKEEFKRINKTQEKLGLALYANPRNIAAGSVRQLDPKVTASRRLDSFTYDIIVGPKTTTHEERHNVLKKLGFKTNTHNKYCKNLEEVFHFYEHVGKIREKLPYEIDGVVVIINNNAIFEKLGVVGKTPRGAIAFKFPQSQSTTIIEDIHIQVGRTGAITPVAVLKPVVISGTTVSRATLHNEDEIARLGVKIGDTVIVGRAGDVIPDIIKVLPELRNGSERNFVMPRVCPSCKTRLSRSRSDRGSSYADKSASGKNTESEALLRCPNQKCFARQRRAFYYFVSRPAFNIEGLGPKIIDRLLDEGLVSDPSDLFSLKEGDLKQLDRFGEKSAENIITSIAERKEITLPRFLYALGIRNIGGETAVDLATHFGSIEKLKNAKLEDLEAILNIGPVVARSIYDWFSDKENVAFLEKLLAAGIKIKNPSKKDQGKLAGQTFVFTGTLDAIDRELAKEKVRELGGQISESVSSKTNFVVVGSDPGSKAEKARTLGVTILDEKAFLEMIG